MRLNNNSFFRFRSAPMLFVMGTIFFLSHRTGDSLSLPSVVGIDKVAHLIAYASLAGTVVFSFSKEIKTRRPLLVAAITVLVCALYGLSDEFHQTFVAGREATAMDLLADVTGACVACLVWVRKQGVLAGEARLEGLSGKIH